MSHLPEFCIRNYDKTFIEFGEDVQESQTAAGQSIASPGFGVEPEALRGILTVKRGLIYFRLQIE